MLSVTVLQWHILFSWAPKSLKMVTAAMKVRYLLLGRKAVTNLDSVLKSRDITLPTNVHLVKAMAFPVVVYGHVNWTIKKAEHQRMDALKLWCWRRLLRVPWTARASQSLKEITLNIHWKDWCRSWSSNTLATWCEELTHWKRPWCWERLKARERYDRGWDGWTASPTQWIWVWASSESWWWTGKPGMLQSMGAQRVGHNWTTTNSNTASRPGLICLSVRLVTLTVYLPSVYPLQQSTSSSLLFT